MAGWFSSNPFGAALGAVGSIAGGIIQNEENKKMMREQMRWNTSEREASQNFTRAERVAQQGYQTSEREAQNAWSESMYKNFQSPEALRAQYSAAGLDPALAISGNAAPAASSGSSGSAPTGASSPTMGITPPYQNMNSFAQGFGEMANALSALAQAKKAGVETMRMEKFVDEEFRGLVLSNDIKEIIKGINKVDLNVKEQMALKQAVAVWNDTNASYEKKVQELENLKKLGMLTQKQVDTYDEMFKNQQDNIKADTFAKEQSGFNSQQQAITEFIKRDLINAQVKKTIAEVGATESLRDFTDTQNRLLKLEENIKKASNEKEKEAAIQQYQAEYYKFMYDGFRLYNLVKPRLNGGNDDAMTQFLDGLYELTNSGMPVDVKHVSESHSHVSVSK